MTSSAATHRTVAPLVGLRRDFPYLRMGASVGSAARRGTRLIFLGIRTLRNGHGWMFFFGIFFPLLWLIGALMQPARPQTA
jgi:hypothetical protein